jgi:glycine betaine/proline transport system ATP-binding protein
MLLDLQTELHKTIVFITHDLDEALRIGDHIAILRDGMMIQQGGPQDIVMKPADDYIVDFIRDINRGRVVHLEKVMDSKIINGVEGGLSATMALEDALPLVTACEGHCLPVVDESGKPIGSISVDAIAKAMARPEESANVVTR